MEEIRMQKIRDNAKIYIEVFKDGNSFCATTDCFINLQESNAGFGKTEIEAIENLLIQIKKENRMNTTNGIEIFDKFYKAEINIQISSFWDGGFTVKIGDEMNGYSHEEAWIKEFSNVIKWFEEKYKELHSHSSKEPEELFERLSASLNPKELEKP